MGRSSIRKPPRTLDGQLEWVSYILANTGVVLSAVQDVSAIAAIPFVSTAVTLLKSIIDTTQAVRDNKAAYQEMQETALHLVAVVVRSCALNTEATWPPPDMKSEINSIMSVLTDTCRFVQVQNSRNIFNRIGQSRADVKEIEKRRRMIKDVLDGLQISSQITSSSKLSRVLAVQIATKDDALAEQQKKDQSIALNKLYKHMENGATHDSSARQEDSTPVVIETRNDAIDKALRWLKDTSSRRPALWVRSAAGFGKTTLANTLCKVAQDSGHLGASFFWSRSNPKRPTTNKRFVATIAYQLCRLKLDSTFTERVVSELKINPAIFHLALSVQMDRLVIQPLLADLFSSKKSLSEPPQSMLIVADGVDECDGPDNQKAVLNTLLDVIRREGLPIRILLCSRNEHAIKQVLEPASSPLDGLVEIMDLKTDNSGVKEYITSQFRIRMANERIHIDWPSINANLEELADKADGVFIFASVVMKYITDPNGLPVTRLRDVLWSSSFQGYTAVYSPLDRLYRHILAKIPSESTRDAWNILLCCVYHQKPTIHEIDCLFDFERGTTAITLRHLSSVINYDEYSHSTPLTFIHTSFPDFLTSRERLGPLAKTFWVSRSQAYAKLTHRYIMSYQSFYSLNGATYTDNNPFEEIRHYLRLLLQSKNGDFNRAGDSTALSNVDFTKLDFRLYFLGQDALEMIWWRKLAKCSHLVSAIAGDQGLLPELYVQTIATFVLILQEGLLKLPLELRPYIPSLLHLFDIYPTPRRQFHQFSSDDLPFKDDSQHLLTRSWHEWVQPSNLKDSGVFMSLCRDPTTGFYNCAPIEEIYAQLSVWLIHIILSGEEKKASYHVLFSWVDIPFILSEALKKASRTNSELRVRVSELLTAKLLDKGSTFIIRGNWNDKKDAFQLNNDAISCKEGCERYLLQAEEESKKVLEGRNKFTLPLATCSKTDSSTNSGATYKLLSIESTALALRESDKILHTSNTQSASSGVTIGQDETTDAASEQAVNDSPPQLNNINDTTSSVLEGICPNNDPPAKKVISDQVVPINGPSTKEVSTNGTIKFAQETAHVDVATAKLLGKVAAHTQFDMWMSGGVLFKLISLFVAWIMKGLLYWR